ncbi:MAG: hypothetical protein NTV34_21855, partial [Proteobacteria bacterium]|nr:hypothetical protein [Pseudomonadota bacterium]
ILHMDFTLVKLSNGRPQLEAALEILADAGPAPSTDSLVMRTLEELIDRRDPIKTDLRAEAKCHSKNKMPDVATDIPYHTLA